MGGRSLLVGLIAVATAAFVIGVVLENNSEEDRHSEPTASARGESEGGEAAKGQDGGEAGEPHAEEGGEGEEVHTEEGAKEDSSGEAASEESDARLLGVDLESTPLVVLAVLASLGLALAVWLRPGWGLLLVVIASVMVVFAALDVREVTHQLDENRTGLALLAGAVAALHLGAGAVAATMTRRPERAASPTV